MAQFAGIYGARHLTYNVHSLIHLATECSMQEGSLDDFSAFVYESFLGKLVRLIGGHKHPLAQLKARLSEIDKLGRHCNFYQQQHKSKAPSFQSVNPKKDKDAHCIDRRGIVYKIACISGNEVFGEVLEKSYLSNGRPEEFFVLGMADDTVFRASNIDIYIVRSAGTPFSKPLAFFNDATKCACFKRDETTNIIYPLLHQMN